MAEKVSVHVGGRVSEIIEPPSSLISINAIFHRGFSSSLCVIYLYLPNAKVV